MRIAPEDIRSPTFRFLLDLETVLVCGNNLHCYVMLVRSFFLFRAKIRHARNQDGPVDSSEEI